MRFPDVRMQEEVVFFLKMLKMHLHLSSPSTETSEIKMPFFSPKNAKKKIFTANCAVPSVELSLT